jgi:DNA helicase-2/ATP-dependent DNA helicase PcrA
MNKLIIASAGSGKTSFIIDDAVKKSKKGERVLITTFTEACEKEIRAKIIKKHGFVPEEITIITWFSFLIRHGVRPFQGSLFESSVKGMLLVNGRSGLKYRAKNGISIYWGEKDFYKFYFTPDNKIYSDKLAQLVVRCNESSLGLVFERISRCFKCIYVDEVQDLAGYDLEVLDCLFKSNADVILVGDPRQATYSTNNSRKNNKYKKSEIVNFFEDSKLDIDIDSKSLTVNYRCFSGICDFSNKLYSQLTPATSNDDEITGHDGIFFLVPDDVDEYLEKYQPMQLRDTKRTEVSDKYPVLNFGKSKGLTLDRVIIYPSGPMVKWLKNNDCELTQSARAKFYVALTRAKHSVAIVLKGGDIKKIEGTGTDTNIKKIGKIEEICLETDRWDFDIIETSSEYQCVAILRKEYGMVVRIYGYISDDVEEITLRTKDLISKVGHKY